MLADMLESAGWASKTRIRNGRLTRLTKLLSYRHRIAAILRRAVKLGLPGYFRRSAMTTASRNVRVGHRALSIRPRASACLRLTPFPTGCVSCADREKSAPKWIADMPLADVLPFLAAWARNPLGVAAVAPSGPAVAALMTRDINARTGPVIELGPGTGPFTYALLDRGVSEQDLTLIEYGSDFLPLLQTRFPKARVLWMDAAWLDKYPLFEEASVGAVISGLGILTMPPRKVIAILTGAFSYLRPDGAFYQITYGPRCPVSDAILDRLNLEATRIGQTLRNVPPASVYRITRRKPEAV